MVTLTSCTRKRPLGYSLPFLVDRRRRHAAAPSGNAITTAAATVDTRNTIDPVSIRTRISRFCNQSPERPTSTHPRVIR